VSEHKSLLEKLANLEISYNNAMQKDTKLMSDIVKCTVQTEIYSLREELIVKADSLVAVLLTGPQLRQATDEVKEIEHRKLNLIVAGLGEGLNEAECLLEYANVKCQLQRPIKHTDIDSVEKLGRPKAPGVPRLL